MILWDLCCHFRPLLPINCISVPKTFLNLGITVEGVTLITDINEKTFPCSSEPLLVPIRVQLLYRQHILREIRANITSHVSKNTH